MKYIHRVKEFAIGSRCDWTGPLRVLAVLVIELTLERWVGDALKEWRDCAWIGLDCQNDDIVAWSGPSVFLIDAPHVLAVFGGGRCLVSERSRCRGLSSALSFDMKIVCIEDGAGLCFYGSGVCVSLF